MTRFAILALFVAACTTETPDLDAPPCEDADGSTCHAAYAIADSVCMRDERCYPAAYTATCVDEVVESLCTDRDCSAPYTAWAEIEECNRIYDQQACVTIGPVRACAL